MTSAAVLFTLASTAMLSSGVRIMSLRYSILT